ncbi:hypothetical protein [Streptacidiphilus fuscans]|uniref:Uncharacterized protein n=1 Tax=Streptacidiphilus fuscans TaxID=2789292 RepID=A0A931B3C2_9ACTN|nr:hypothetical protein [Streptacidiphilus fuscans]MBF9070450.1 hypothetical protein [Streptacidiphilus fuscans]
MRLGKLVATGVAEDVLVEETHEEAPQLDTSEQRGTTDPGTVPEAVPAGAGLSTEQ